MSEYPPGTPEEPFQENAEKLAPLAAFYGLSAEQVVVAHGYSQGVQTTFRGALDYLIATSHELFVNHSFPRYIEVLAPVPVFGDGYSHVIVEFSE